MTAPSEGGSRRPALWWLLTAAALQACGGSRPAVEPAGEAHASCGQPAAFEGGSFLVTDDGVPLWYRVAGPANAPTVLFLHGGPGYNSYGFELAVGRLLERSLRMVYLDQRGCGRSAGGAPGAAMGMDATVADLERLRLELGVERWHLVGHSFGGVVARVFLRAHPEQVDRLVLVDTTWDLPAALAHQVATLRAAAPERFPDHEAEVQRIAAGTAAPIEQLGLLYGVLGRAPAQRVLQWASPEHQTLVDGWDEASGLMGCTREEVPRAMQRDGYLVEPMPELARPLERPALLIAGRASQVIGAAQIEAAAASWEVPVVWLEHSGHHPYAEEPERFAEVVVSFLTSRPGAATDEIGRR